VCFFFATFLKKSGAKNFTEMSLCKVRCLRKTFRPALPLSAFLPLFMPATRVAACRHFFEKKWRKKLYSNGYVQGRVLSQNFSPCLATACIFTTFYARDACRRLSPLF